MKLLSGRNVSQGIFDKLLKDIKKFDESPKLLSIIIGDNPVAVSYANAKGRKAGALGTDFEILDMPGNVEQKKAEKDISQFIKSRDPDGVIIERPLPKGLDFAKLAKLVPQYADVDCQRMDSLGRLLTGNPGYIPATPGAVIEILKHYEISVRGKNVVIIGRSLSVGLPLSIMLSCKNGCGNATVTLCHSKTWDISSHTKRADVLIVAAGKPKLITQDMVTKNTVIIDVGATYEGGKLLGDVDFDNVSENVSAITPVPGGVGPVTTAYLFQNLVNSCIKRKYSKIKE